MTDKPKVTGFKAQLPNLLTIGRILCIPFLVAGIVLAGHDNWYAPTWVGFGAFFLFGIACISDYLDGYWARKWNVTSDFGRMIDPIADKLLVAACLIALCICANGLWIILIPALAIIGRDILVSGAREFAALKGRAMPPTKLAKWKTACEMFAISILLFLIALHAYHLEFEILSDSFRKTLATLGFILLWIAAVLSVYTGSLYLRAALKD